MLDPEVTGAFPKPSKDLEGLKQLVAAVLASRKYRQVAPELVRQIGEQSLVKCSSLKDAIKATKNKLHQVAGSYLGGKTDYGAWLNAIELGYPNPAELRRVCARIMSHHASTVERLPILDEFYARLFADLQPIGSILDLACGLNPLAIPWMPLPPGVEYYACDVMVDQIEFVNRFLSIIGVAGEATVCNLLESTPACKADVALLLKTIPCLEQVDKHAGGRLLAEVEAPVIFVSFPAQSLGGRHKGMPAHYEAHFRQLVAASSWRIERFEFATESVFRVDK